VPRQQYQRISTTSPGAVETGGWLAALAPGEIEVDGAAVPQAPTMRARIANKAIRVVILVCMGLLLLRVYESTRSLLAMSASSLPSPG
jgi:hypothetical protein